MNDLVYSIGEFVAWTFGLLETLGNLPNILFTVLIMAGLAGWMIRQQRYLREDRAADRLI
jgi:hypothetical protein